MPRPSQRRRATLSVALGLFVGAALLAASCGGSSNGQNSLTTTSETNDTSTTTIDPLAPVTFADPNQPVSVGLGRRFELLLPADPTRGWRWVLEPVDTAVVVPLSSEFRDDPELLASTTTTTTLNQSSTASPAPTVTWEPTTTTTIDPNSPEAAPLVQIITFAGRSLATTDIVLRYEQIGASSSNARTETYKVSVHANLN